MPSVTVGDGGVSATAAPAAVVTSSTGPAVSGSGGRKLPSRKVLFGGLAALVIVGGAAAWYFGYHMNPSVIYSQSLSRTGKGYDKLVDYVDTEQQLTDKGYTGQGSYKIKAGSFSTDGKIALKGDSDNAELTFDVGVGVSRVNADIRTLKSSGDTPDIYVKAADIKGLGSVVGIPELDDSLAKLDNKWIVIDHTLIDNLTGIATAQAQAKSLKGPTRDQVLDEARAFGKVNQQYVFSTKKDKAVLKVVKKYGKETVDGHKTYHYQVALQKDNVKKYIYAQRDALTASKLGDWLKQNKYDKDVTDEFNNAADSTKDIKDSDTFDIWMDTGTRMVYKVRFPEDKDAANNYLDVGLDYKGGDTFPFFIAGKGKSDSTTTFRFAATLNTKSGATNYTFNIQDSGSDNDTGSFKFDLKPASSVKIAKPANAEPLSQLLNELGYGDILSQYTATGVQAKATDSKRATDIATIQTQLEAFFQNKGYYPSLEDMNNDAWLKANMKSLDTSALADPSHPDTKKLAAAPAAGVYAYAVTNASGGSCESDDTQCAKYTLTATYETTGTGPSTISKSNLD